MTYCVGIKTNEGIVLASDSRTNAGLDNVNIYSKMLTYDVGDRTVIIVTSGNLGTSQAVFRSIEKDINDKRFANIGKFAEPRNIKFKTVLVPPQAGGISGTQMREFIKNNDN